MRLLGLSGYATSGKDAAAAALVEDGWTRIAFADKLRDVLLALNPIVGYSYEYGNITLRQEYDLRGWNCYKTGDFKNEIRSLLQRLGTEAGREVLGENIWVDAALSNLDPEGSYVVTDCRFPNEVLGIRQRDGIVVRINRPGVTAVNSHISDHAIDTVCFEAYIENDGSLADLHFQVRQLVKDRL